MPEISRRFPSTKVTDWSSGAFGTPAALPGAPSDVAATAGNTQVVLTWTAGAANFGTLSGYKVEKNSGSWSDVTADTGSTSTTYTVTGLSNGTAYTFRISAINEVGTGSASSASSAVTPLTVPGAPTSVSASAAPAGTTSATLSWSAPSSTGGSAIIGYSIKRDSTEIIYDTGDTTTSYIDGEASAATGYTYYVAAVNAAGQSAYSSGAAVTTGSTKDLSDPKATGGEIGFYNTGGTDYWVHAFYATEAFVPSTSLTCEIMTIAGGGGGATTDTAAGGGGGAGGLVYYTATAFSAASHTITVGAGGARGQTPNTNGNQGSNSQAGSLTAAVGGGEGTIVNQPGGAGGSGGGAGSGGGGSGTGGAPTANQGYIGGARANLADYNGGGGGGAGGAGAPGAGNTSASTSVGGAGVTEGSSTVYNFNGGGTATLHVNGTGFAYCGGGGAGCQNTTNGWWTGAGGSGGGGQGGQNPAGTTSRWGASGLRFTGAGGGGSGEDYPGGDGGHGVVFIRYAA